MKFKELLPTFIAGTDIKRKPWGGFWRYRRGQILMFTKEGEVVNFVDSKDILFTISHFFEDDWEVATPENLSSKIVGHLTGEISEIISEHKEEQEDKYQYLNAAGIISEEFHKALKGAGN
jgi:hypothetical protein